MKRVLVLAEDSTAPDSDFETLRLATTGGHRNVELETDVFRTEFLASLPDRVEDLLYLATFVYVADAHVKRGSKSDVFGDDWARHFKFVMPMKDLEFWKRHVQEVSDILGFLTGDEFDFDFRSLSIPRKSQQLFKFREPVTPAPHVDVVVAFSGGLDSLAASIIAAQEKRRPVLASHYAAPTINSRQRSLVGNLTRSIGVEMPHLTLRAHRRGGTRPTEFSQRSRSFLFSSFATATASLLGVGELWLCDNGVTSINLPQSQQNVGTFLSRSTHPRFIEQLEPFLRAVTANQAFSVRNVLELRTKKEVVEIIGEAHPALLQEAVSCAHVEGMTLLQPHCGVCTQCIDRRFATVAAGYEPHDLAERYQKDIFTAELSSGDERTHAENYVRFAATLEKLSTAEAFLTAYAELFDCFPASCDQPVRAEALFQLFQRHQTGVNAVLESMLQKHAAALRQGLLPRYSLVRMISAADHLADPRDRYVRLLERVFQRGLPSAFKSQPAINELHMQDVGEALLRSAKESLDRESPQIPFGVITTKPDFSDIDPATKPLFIEFKYVKDRKALNRIVTEITSRITIYGDQGAAAMFVVYDPKRAILDDPKFVETLERENVWVTVIR